MLRVTPGVDGIELCRTRTCEAPQRLVVGADGHATPAKDLEAGTWFWRVAGGDASPPGPLWSIVIRRGAGLSSRVHGYDANGDGIADVPIEASLLLGSATALASKFARVPFAKLDAVRTEAPAARSPSTLIFPVGDVDGDGFDDAVLGERLARGGPDGIRPEAEWLACPPGGCGAAAGDVDDDGYADLQGKDGLQLGSPTGLRPTAAPLLDGDATVRAASDLDGDGIADLAIMSADQRSISVLRGGPHGLTLGASTSLEVPKNAAVHFEVADVDGDGNSDLVVLLSEKRAAPPSALRTTVIVRLTPPGGDISHAVERRVTWSTPAGAGMGPSAELFIADVDGDGFDDVVVFFGGPHVGRARVVRGSKGALRLEPGAVGFQPEDDMHGASFFSTGDVNGDGRDDVLFVGVPSVGFMQAFDFTQAEGAASSPSPSWRTRWAPTIACLVATDEEIRGR